MTMRLHPCGWLLAAALSAPASSQIVVHQSLTDWGHAWGTPYWTDDVPEATAEFGKMDRLNYVWWFEYNSPELTLQPGWYAMTMRLRKTNSMTSAQPMDLRINPGSGLITKTSPISILQVGQWVRTPALVFFVLQPNTKVKPGLWNILGTYKQNYEFDSVRIGRIDVSALIYENITSHWTTTESNVSKDVKDTVAQLGVAERLVSASSWKYSSGAHALAPGVYTAQVRLKKAASTAGRSDLDLVAVIGTSEQKITIPAASQIIDQYIWSAPLPLNLTAATTVKFELRNTDGTTTEQDYLFDAFALSYVAQQSPYGAACKSSLGVVDLTLSAAPRIGLPLGITITNSPGAAVVMVGAQKLNIELGGLGAPTCWLLQDLVWALPAGAASGNTATLALPIPYQPSFVGLRPLLQGLVPDRNANQAGLATTRGVEVVIGS